MLFCSCFLKSTDFRNFLTESSKSLGRVIKERLLTLICAESWGEEVTTLFQKVLKMKQTTHSLSSKSRARQAGSLLFTSGLGRRPAGSPSNITNAIYCGVKESCQIKCICKKIKFSFVFFKPLKKMDLLCDALNVKLTLHCPFPHFNTTRKYQCTAYPGHRGRCEDHIRWFLWEH